MVVGQGIKLILIGLAHRRHGRVCAHAFDVKFVFGVSTVDP